MKRLVKTPVKTVDDYLSQVPEDARVTLEKIRQSIRAAAPNAEECISYQIPAYKQNGMLVGFGAAKEHCSFFVMSPRMMKKLMPDLEKYETATATIHFPFNKPLPKSLVSKIVKARLEENDHLRGKKSGKT